MTNQQTSQTSSCPSSIFGLSCTAEDSKVVYIPVPWDVTTSYAKGTSNGPKAIQMASEQIDFFDIDYGHQIHHGYSMAAPPEWLTPLNQQMRQLAEQVMLQDVSDLQRHQYLKKINQASDKLNNYLYQETKNLLNQSKVPIIVGGDHSTPYGAIKAYSEHYNELGILHIDAHSDTRKAYMGFTHSHASILYNVLETIPNITKVTQLGIRDFCQEEFDYIQNNPKLNAYFDQTIRRQLFNGISFSSLVDNIVDELPDYIYLTLDIDGLDPKYCPNTGTPVPGGLTFNETLFIIKRIIEKKKVLVGFDLVEVAPSKNANEWDANVGMRLLYKLTNACLFSQQTQA